jgi:hypothetical protein
MREDGGGSMRPIVAAASRTLRAGRNIRMSHARGRVSAQFRFENHVRADLRERRWVRVHIACIGLVTFAVLWGLSHALLRAGVESMALRHGAALVGAYAVYLGLLWLWARWLLSRHEGEVPDLGGPDGPGGGSGGSARGPDFQSGGGGDFGGGGASGSFDGGEVASAAAEVVGGADEGAIVLVPLALVVGAAVLLGAALGFAVFGLFGVEVLLGVAVEIAFASAGGALAFKARREGWLGHALRRTIAPMAVVLAATVATGLALAHWLPRAATLPQALKLLFG